MATRLVGIASAAVCLAVLVAAAPSRYVNQQPPAVLWKRDFGVPQGRALEDGTNTDIDLTKPGVVRVNVTGTVSSAATATHATSADTATSALTAATANYATAAGVATVLSSNGDNCDPGQAPLGVDAAGNAEGCFSVVTTETDPKVYPQSGPGLLCLGDGTGVECDYSITDVLPVASASALGAVKGDGSDTTCDSSGLMTGWNSSTGAMTCSTNAPTATALATNPTDCAAGTFATSIDTGANLTCSAESDPQVGTLGAAGQWCTTDGSAVNCSSAAPLTSITGGACSEQSVIAISNSGAVTCGTVKIAEDRLGSVKGRGSSLGTTCTSGEVMYGFDTSVAEGHADYGRMVCRPPLASVGCTSPEILQGFDASGDEICVSETDPKVGTISSGKWCVGTAGGQVSCGANVPAGQGSCSGNGAVTETTASGVTCTTFPAVQVCPSEQYISGFSSDGTANCSKPVSLAYNGSNCSAGYAARGVDSGGAAEDCFAVVTAESDPQVGSVTASSGSNWCRSDGSAVQCNNAAPSVGSITGGVCSTGYVMTGITTSGVPICTMLTGACSSCLSY